MGRSRARSGPALLFRAFFAPQYDDPEKQDRHYGTNDSNHGGVHSSLSFPDKIEFGVSSPNL
jgi:hypothetical protein